MKSSSLRELDAQIALDIFGKRKPEAPVYTGPISGPVEWKDGWYLLDKGRTLEVVAPPYSSDLDTAVRTLVPWLFDQGYGFELKFPCYPAAYTETGPYIGAQVYSLQDYYVKHKIYVPMSRNEDWQEKVALMLAWESLRIHGSHFELVSYW